MISSVILGIDAAWTESEPSGVALVRSGRSGWECVAVAPSYEGFVELARGKPVDWKAPKGSSPDARQLLQAARTMAGREVEIVTIDMPISRAHIACRRAADQAVAAEFGSRWCGTHSPGPSRPGAFGARICADFARLGYRIATTDTACGAKRHLVEVYPHPALLALLQRDRRVPYKTSKSSAYWPGEAVEVRRSRLLDELRNIEAALGHAFGPTRVPIPPAAGVVSFGALKAIEDALDALVCCWVGTLFAAGEAVPMGDDRAAIWCPASVVRGLVPA